MFHIFFLLQARIQPFTMAFYYKDPKLSSTCCIPMQKLENIWGPETRFFVRKNSNGEYFKIKYEKWEGETIVADIIEDIFKVIYKRELEQILNGSDSSWNGNLSFMSFNESFESCQSSKRNNVIESLKINAKFDTTNLGRTRKSKKKINYADLDVSRDVEPPKLRKSRRKSVYAHVTASIPEIYTNSYANNPQARFENEFKPIPKTPSKPRKKRVTKPKKPAPVYNEQIAMEYTQTIDAVARYNEICRETLEDEYSTPDIQIYIPEVIPDITKEILEIIPETSFKSLPSLTDSFEVERFFQQNNAPEIPSNVKPVAEFFIEPNGVNDYRVQSINPIINGVSISIPLAKIQEKEQRKDDNFELKRKSFEVLKSKEKRRKFVNHSTQTDRESNLRTVNHQQHIDQANSVTSVERSSDDKNMVFILNFYAPVSSSDIEMLKGAINEAVSSSSSFYL